MFKEILNIEMMEITLRFHQQGINIGQYMQRASCNKQHKH